jgi:AbiV family abortive infection protein
MELSMTRTTPLTPAQLSDLSAAALGNAVELLADARALLKARRWPRAYALAILAGEELGKALLCYPAKTLASNDIDGWGKFWVNFKRHPPKLAIWASEFLSITVDSMTNPTNRDEMWNKLWPQSRYQLVKAGLDGKMSAIYVDFNFDKNSVSIPGAMVDKSRATSMVNVVASVVEQTSSVFERELEAESSAPILAELQAAIDNATSDDDIAEALCVMLRRLRQLPAPA